MQDVPAASGGADLSAAASSTSRQASSPAVHAVARKDGKESVEEKDVEEDHPRPVQLLYKYKTFLRLWDAEAPAIRGARFPPAYASV